MSENVGHVGDQDFENEVLHSEVPVLVDFWAEWCTPCHIVSPVVEEIAREQQGKLRAVKLNVDDSPDIAQHYGVMSIPTLILFRDGEPQHRIVGARGKADGEGRVSLRMGSRTHPARSAGGSSIATPIRRATRLRWFGLPAS